ncbi:alpha/beta fold hydrolase [Variovorax terrae]|uniref:Alpha/beta hydrolase n=1 Tax=Variovorax terrae TaxID=2923278 RepID=A0A9X2APZ8_9BURK|nr:alpha/beta hydrolase [Variovorax terrae]MCJ0764017.1 alpha/beta hydrolase [Variovorax terrae]
MELINVNGVRLEVQRLEGSSAHSPLVFLHEGLGSVAMWKDWPAEVCAATGRAGVVYSRRGYGGSDPVPDVRGTGRLAPDYMHREAWEVLPALLQALAIERPVLLGHSDGGSIALLHASRHAVAACLAMAPHVIVEELSVRSIAEARTAFESGGLRERLARYHADVDGAFWQWNDIWLSEAFRSFDIRPDCRRIDAPVLAIQGLDDPYGTLAQIEQIAPTRGSVTLETLAQCGHSPHRDQAARVTQRIAGFLQTQD